MCDELRYLPPEQAKYEAATDIQRPGDEILIIADKLIHSFSPWSCFTQVMM